MKVVCIETPPTSVTIDVNPGDVFDLFYKSWGVGVYNYIVDKLGNVIPCDVEDDSKYFISIEEWRQLQLDKILNRK